MNIELPSPRAGLSSELHDRTGPQARIRSLGKLPDHLLHSELLDLNRRDHRLQAELLLYLGELDQRGLYRERAVSSTFEYCVQRLGYSEDVAYKRVGVARLLRRYPVIYELLIEQRVHLTALMLVKPHLTDANHRDWLSLVCGMSKRQVERLIAARCPRPDVPTSVRKIPHRAPAEPTLRPESGGEPDAGGHVDAAHVEAVEKPATIAPVTSRHVDAAPGGSIAPGETKDDSLPSSPTPVTAASFESQRTPAIEQPRCHRPRIEPLSSCNYRVTFTATERLKAKLDRASELLSHSVQPGDLPTILERALDRLLELEERRRYGAARRCDVSPQQELSPSARAQEAPTAQVPSRPDRQHSVSSDDAAKAGLDPDPTPRPQPRGDLLNTEMALSRLRGELSSTETDPSRLRGSLSSTEIARGTVSIPGCEQPLQHSNTGHTQPTATVTSIEQPDVARRTNRRRRPPASVRRAVFERDQGQCTFVDAEGRRCTGRHCLEFDHVDAFAVGGDSSVENVRLLCRWHNRLEAERLFGSPLVRRAIAHAKSRRATPKNEG